MIQFATVVIFLVNSSWRQLFHQRRCAWRMSQFRRKLKFKSFWLWFLEPYNSHFEMKTVSKSSKTIKQLFWTNNCSSRNSHFKNHTTDFSFIFSSRILFENCKTFCSKRALRRNLWSLNYTIDVFKPCNS